MVHKIFKMFEFSDNVGCGILKEIATLYETAASKQSAKFKHLSISFCEKSWYILFSDYDSPPLPVPSSCVS